jgi:hypothetical protein
VSLREGAIEAIAVNAIAPPPPVHQEDMEIASQIASDALDAILNYLEANRDAVVEASYRIENGTENEAHHEAVTLIRRIALSRVIAALRIQENQP